jgi:hypothetical protein
MISTPPRRAILKGALVALIFVPLSSQACGPEFGKQVPDAQAVKYVGFARDQSGQGVGNTTVIISVVGEELTTDAKGGFLTNLGRDEDSPDIHFICRKAGYQTVMATKAPSRTDKLRVFVTCSMRKI